MRRTDSLEKTLIWERLKVGEGDNRRWDGWIASPTWWTWVWASSGRWWWTGRPGILQSKSRTWLSDWTELTAAHLGEGLQHHQWLSRTISGLSKHCLVTAVRSNAEHQQLCTKGCPRLSSITVWLSQKKYRSKMSHWCKEIEACGITEHEREKERGSWLKKK